MEHAGEQSAVYSKVDQNGHLNNTEYASIVCDLVPISQITEHPVRSMVLAYHNEPVSYTHLDVYKRQSVPCTPMALAMSLYFSPVQGALYSIT